MAENIVNSYNLFVDSSTGRDSASKGDNYHLHLGNAGITCESGQYIRLTLNNFTMHKTFTDVNAAIQTSHYVARSPFRFPRVRHILVVRLEELVAAVSVHECHFFGGQHAFWI
jgi:hypothetical protein